MKKLFIDAEIDIKLLTTEEALMLDDSLGLPDVGGDDDGWFPGIW